MIPAQAVEAACEQLNEAGVYVSPKYMRAALEAAAPHILAEVERPKELSTSALIRQLLDESEGEK